MSSAASISEGMWYLLTLCGLTNLINMLNLVVCRHLCELLRQWDLVCELSYSTIASSTPQKDCLLACLQASVRRVRLMFAAFLLRHGVKSSAAG